MSGKDPKTASPCAIEPTALSLCYAEAAQAYPEEACGLLSGPRESDLCDEVRPCKNRQNDLHLQDPETYPRDATMAYNLGARDILYLSRSLDGPRPVKIIYHSHCDVGAYFSEEDRRAATFEDELLYPVDYLVIDCAAAGVRGALLFRFQDGQFVEIASYPAAA